jgi:hypothetical protein
MKFFDTVTMILALILIAACSPEATSNGSTDISAQADGGSSDGSVVGSDAGDTDTTSNDVVPTDKVDGDTTDQTDVGGDIATTDETDTAKPFCPQPGDPAEATLEIALADGPQCFIPGSDEAMMVLAFVNAKVGIGNHPLANLMPADPAKPDGTGGCSLQTIHNTDYCFATAKVYGHEYKPTTWEGNKTTFPAIFYLVIVYPETKPLASTEVAFKGCADSVCDFESATIQDYYQDRANYSTASKLTNITQCENGTCSKPDQYKFE